MLFIISDGGSLVRGKHITLATSSQTYSQVLAHNVLKAYNDFYIFTGHSYGYVTSI